MVIRSERWVFLGAVQHIFHENALQATTMASKRLSKAVRASHGPRVSLPSQAKESKKNQGKFTGLSKVRRKGSKGAKGSCQGKASKTGISGLENLKSEICSETQESVQMGQVFSTDTSWIYEDWSPDEWNDAWNFDD